jgi:hypothetical protein
LTNWLLTAGKIIRDSNMSNMRRYRHVRKRLPNGEISRDKALTTAFGPQAKCPSRARLGQVSAVHRPRARYPVDVVGAPAFDPFETFARQKISTVGKRGTPVRQSQR